MLALAWFRALPSLTFAQLHRVMKIWAYGGLDYWSQFLLHFSRISHPHLLSCNFVVPPTIDEVYFPVPPIVLTIFNCGKINTKFALAQQ